MGRISRTVAAAAALILSLTGLTACNSIVNPGGGEDTLTVYSNSLSDGRGEWLTERAKEAGFELQLVDVGGGAVYNRLVAEKASPIADITFGLNDVYFQKLISENVLEAYVPDWASTLDQDAVDASGMYYPIVREPIMLVCNNAAFNSSADMPQDWPDLWEKEQFHGRYEVPSSLDGATVQMVISGIMARHLDKSGKLGVSDAGWYAISQWYTNGKRSQEGTDLYAQMATGNVDCGQMWLAGKVSREKEYNVQSTAAQPKIGVPMVRQGVALIKGSKHEETAKKFIDWFGSAEVQASWSQEFATTPMNQNALDTGNREAIEFTNSFKGQDIDWKLVAKNLDSWVEEIQLNYAK